MTLLYKLILSADGAGIGFVDLMEGDPVASLATVTPDPNGGFVVAPATQADIDAFYTANVAPKIDAQIDPKIVAVEQRMWQTMVNALSNKSVEILNAVDARDVSLEVAMIQNCIAALQARLAVLTQP